MQVEVAPTLITHSYISVSVQLNNFAIIDVLFEITAKCKFYESVSKYLCGFFSQNLSPKGQKLYYGP